VSTWPARRGCAPPGGGRPGAGPGGPAAAGAERGGAPRGGEGRPAMRLFPPIPLEEWDRTKATLHRFEQIVGKIRMASSPRRNHWWHVPFRLTGTGITTRPMGLVDGNPLFTVDFDFVRHLL